jgi:cytidylate kinase
MHITITGNLGSGKSTICKILEDKHGFEIYSTGKVQREIAREMNMTTLEMNKLMCSDRKYDNMIDDATARLSRENKHKNIIFDSRLAWHFVEESFKVFLSVSLSVAAERVMNDNRGKEEQYSSVTEARELLAARAETENKRYKDMYDLEYFNFANYNLVIDSTYCSPEIAASIIMEESKKQEKLRQETGKYIEGTRILMSPRRLFSGIVTNEEKADLSGKVEEFKKLNYYLDNPVSVKRDGDNYMVIDGLNDIKAALLADICFVPVVIK